MIERFSMAPETERNGWVFMGTWIAGMAVLIIAGFSIRSIVKDKKAGKSIQCGGSCKNCNGHCHER